MATEIELKYSVVNEQVVEKITALLNEDNISYSFGQNQLANRYFDTKQLLFRKHDFGLRVRSVNEHREQTIKTAGQVIGGLHKRPEYNVDISDNFPDLSLFPAEIWPDNISLEQWQAELIVLFSTDFKRHTWTIDFQSSQIELAFDVGTIASSGNSIDICEIELELLEGIEADIFDLAEKLMGVLLMRPGIHSKAARGYQLWHQQHIEKPEDFPFVPLTGEMSIARSFVAGNTFLLSYLQRAIDYYFIEPHVANLSRINHALLLIRHGFWVFEAFISDDMVEIRKELSHFLTMLAWENNAKNLHELINKSSYYRKKIEYNQQLIEQLKLEKRRFPSQEQVKELLQSKRFNLLQLKLLKMLLAGEKQLSLPSDNLPSIFKFCSKTLEISLLDVEDEMPEAEQLPAEQYLSLKKILNRSLLTGSWCGQVYDDKARHEYRAPWLDILHGITELETLTMLRNQLLQLQAIEAQEQPEKLLNWLDVKIENLLHALDASKQMAVQLPPYWRS